MLIDAVYCRICYQRPWRVEGQDRQYDMTLVFHAWCHGAHRKWTIGEEVIRAAVGRDVFEPLMRALIAFAAMPIALPPILVRIRRCRGRRLPVPPRDRLTVWCM